jgi:hypothetical protein
LLDGTDTRTLIGPNLDGSKIKEIATLAGNDGVIQLKPDGTIGDIVAFKPEQIKSAIGNNGKFDPKNSNILMSDTSKPGAAIQAMKNTNKPFYSAVENAVAAAKQPKADAQQWLSFLKNQPGVKQEELSHLGLDKLSGAITKDDLLKTVQEGQPQIKEVIKGGKNPYPHSSTEEWESAIASAERSNNWDEVDRLNQAWEHSQGVGAGKDATKYNKYQLPGGENYREMLLTLPDKQQRHYEWEYFDPKTQTSKQFKTEAEAKAAAPEGAMVNPKEISTTNESYKSSHWDEPNVLAHIRMNDRNIDGKKSLHLEEIQSDWHQEGRKKGYKGQNKENRNLDDIQKDLAKAHNDLVNNPNAETKASYDKFMEERRLALGEGLVPDAPFKKTWDELALKKAITHAVKNGYDSISWTPGEAQAARYDLSKQVEKLSYNPKQQYIKAWDKNGREVIAKEAVKPEDLPNIVGKEAAEKLLNQEPKNFDKLPDVERKNLTVNETEHQYVVKNSDGRTVSPGKGVVGSKEEALDYAERYFNNKAKEINRNRELEYGRLGPTHILESQDLKVGGQGMKAFYDKMLVDKMNALTKKYGGKVEKGEVETHRGYPEKLSVYDKDGHHVKDFKTMAEARTYLADPANGVKGGSIKGNKAVAPKTDPVHILKITPELREHVLKKGFPLFSAGVPVFSPIDYDPFKSKDK